MGTVTAGAIGLGVGLLVGWGAGRRSERAAQAWSATWSSYLLARELTGQAAGYVVAVMLLACLAGAAFFATR